MTEKLEESTDPPQKRKRRCAKKLPLRRWLIQMFHASRLQNLLIDSGPSADTRTAIMKKIGFGLSKNSLEKHTDRRLCPAADVRYLKGLGYPCEE